MCWPMKYKTNWDKFTRVCYVFPSFLVHCLLLVWSGVLLFGPFVITTHISVLLWFVMIVIGIVYLQSVSDLIHIKRYIEENRNNFRTLSNRVFVLHLQVAMVIWISILLFNHLN